MPTNRQDITAKIVSILKGVASLNNRVYDYQVGQFEGFPTALVIGQTFTDRIADTARNIRVYVWDIMVYVERSKQGFGSKNAERKRRELEDEITEAFDSNQNLDSSVLWSRVFQGGWGYSGDENLAFFSLQIHAYQTIDIS